jgi:hypothetical protein
MNRIKTKISAFILTAVIMLFPVALSGCTDNGMENPPSAEIEYSMFSLTLPSAEIIPASELKDKPYNDFWYAGAGAFEGYDMFQTPYQGKSISGSSYPRCELREVNSNGTNPYFGNGGYHRLYAEVKGGVVNANPLSGAAVNGADYTCIMQWWGSAGGIPSMFCLYYGNFSKNGEGTNFAYLPPQPGAPTKWLSECEYTDTPKVLSIPFGTPFTAEVIIDNGILRCYIECLQTGFPKTLVIEEPVADYLGDNAGYFTIGNYDRSAVNYGSVPSPADKHTAIGFKRIEIEHGSSD